MPVYVDSFPQSTTPITVVNIRELVAVLPEELPWKINVWLGGKLARFGVTTEVIVFLAEMEAEPSVEQRLYFERLIAPLGLPATLYEGWRSKRYEAVRLYNEGLLAIDRETLCYRCLPTPVYAAPIITKEEFLARMPRSIPYCGVVYLTGGMVKNGWSANDIDFIVPEVRDRFESYSMAKYFSDILGWKVDVGPEVMKEREPVYLFKLYEGGKWLL